MSEAVLNLITRDAVELHFEGATYGPVAHTEPLAVLLFLLSPSSVRCIANGRRFEDAMRRLLDAAQAARALLEQVCEGNEDEGQGTWPPAKAIDCWVESALKAVPPERAAELRLRCAERMEPAVPRATFH
jgi:hypothetical protein